MRSYVLEEGGTLTAQDIARITRQTHRAMVETSPLRDLYRGEELRAEVRAALAQKRPIRWPE